MDIIFATLGVATLIACGGITWHLLTDDDDECRESCDFDYVMVSIAGCTHPDVGQHGGECECGERIEIGGSE